jgi:hypothetical protein
MHFDLDALREGVDVAAVMLALWVVMQVIR